MAVIPQPLEIPIFVDFSRRGNDTAIGSKRRPVRSVNQALKLFLAYAELDGAYSEQEYSNYGVCVKVRCSEPTCTLVECNEASCNKKICKTHRHGYGMYFNASRDIGFNEHYTFCKENCQVCFCATHRKKFKTCDICTIQLYQEAEIIGMEWDDFCKHIYFPICPRHATICQKEIFNEDKVDEICGYMCCSSCINYHTCGSDWHDYGDQYACASNAHHFVGGYAIYSQPEICNKTVEINEYEQEWGLSPTKQLKQ